MVIIIKTFGIKYENIRNFWWNNTKGVVSASNETELKSKITTVLDGVREPIKSITVPSFNDFNDMEAHEITVEYDSENCDNEEFLFNVLTLFK